MAISDGVKSGSKKKKLKGDVSSQKIKLLKIMDLLRRTSEYFSLSTEEIRQRLERTRATVGGESVEHQNEEEETSDGRKRVGIACHRHTLAKDIDALESYGYNVENTGEFVDGQLRGVNQTEKDCLSRWNVKRSRANRYFMPVGDRLSNTELRLLELSVQASRILDDAGKQTIISKLQGMKLDSHLYSYLENAFHSDLEEGGSLLLEPQERRYFMECNGEKLEVGDNCSAFLCGDRLTPSLKSLDSVIDPLENALLTGSLVRFYTFDYCWNESGEPQIMLRGNDGKPFQHSVYPVALSYYDGKAYLLAIAQETIEKLHEDVDYNCVLDGILRPYRIDCICHEGLRSSCNPVQVRDLDLNIEIRTQVKARPDRSGRFKNGVARASRPAARKMDTDVVRETNLAKVLRIKQWLSVKENFDALMRRNPHMFFENRNSEEPKVANLVTVRFRRNDYSVLRSLRDEFGRTLRVYPDLDGEYLRADLSVYSWNVFAAWFLGFGAYEEPRLYVVNPSEELQSVIARLQHNSWNCILGGVGMSEQAVLERKVQEVANSGKVDVREFLARLTESALGESGDRKQRQVLYDALRDCLARLEGEE